MQTACTKSLPVCQSGGERTLNSWLRLEKLAYDRLAGHPSMSVALLQACNLSCC